TAGSVSGFLSLRGSPGSSRPREPRSSPLIRGGLPMDWKLLLTHNPIAVALRRARDADDLMEEEEHTSLCDDYLLRQEPALPGTEQAAPVYQDPARFEESEPSVGF